MAKQNTIRGSQLQPTIAPLIIIALMPLLFSRGLENSFGLPKAFALALACAMALSSLSTSQYTKTFAARLKHNTPALLSVIWLFWSLISVAWADFHIPGIINALYLSAGPGIFLFSIATTITPRSRRLILTAVIAVACFQCCFAFIQFLGVDPVFGDVTSTFAGHNATRRIIGTIGYQNMLASYLALVLPACGFLSLTAPGRRGQFAWCLICTIMLIALLLTRCRSAAIAAIAGMTTYAFLLLRQKITPVSNRTLAWTAAAFCSALVIAFAITSHDSKLSLSKRFMDLFEGKSESAAQRTIIWKATVSMITERPLTGSGLGSFGMLYLDHLGKTLSKPENRHFSRYVVNAKESHNDYLQIWAETGIIGLVAWLAFLAAAGTRLLALSSASHRNQEDCNWSAACFSVLVVFAVDSLFNFPLHTISVVPFFWMLLGLGLNQAGEPELEHETTKHKSLVISLTAVTSVIFGLLIYADSLFAKARAEMLSSQSEAAEEHYRAALRIMPWDGRLHFFFGSCLMALNKNDQAFEQMNAAASSFADINLWRNMAKLDLYMKEPQDAIDRLQRASSSFIEYIQVQRELGIAFLAADDSESACKAWNRTVKTRRPDPETAILLARLLIKQGKLPDAREALAFCGRADSRSLKELPGKFSCSNATVADGLDLIGVSYLMETNPACAEAHLRNALAISPDAISPRNNLAAAFKMLGRNQEAVEQWQVVLQKDPKNQTARKNLQAEH